MSRRRSSTRSPERSSSTTPNGPTCSTSLTPPRAPAPACAPDDVRPGGGPRGPSLQWALDTFTAPGNRPQRPHGPAGRQPSRAAAMHSSIYDSDPTRPPNFARYTFLDEDSHRFYPHWDSAADICVAILRTEAGRDPHDTRMHDLVGELSTRSQEFRRRWGSHDVRLHGAGANVPPQHRRRSRAGLRKRGHGLRTRADAHPLRRRTRLAHRPRPRAARLLDRPAGLRGRSFRATDVKFALMPLIPRIFRRSQRPMTAIPPTAASRVAAWHSHGRPSRRRLGTLMYVTVAPILVVACSSSGGPLRMTTNTNIPAVARRFACSHKHVAS